MSSNHTMSTSQRIEFSRLLNNHSPGPGVYTYDKLPRQSPPKYKIGKSKRPDIVFSKNPGPGTYDQKMQFGATTGFHFGKSNALDKSSGIPGPGYYDTKQRMPQTPSFSMRMKTINENFQLEKFRAKSPGPTSYETNYSTIINRPSYKIGPLTNTSNQNRSLSPGPGRYLETSFKGSPPYSIIGKEVRKSPVEMPITSTSKLQKLGPGSYDIKSTIQNNIGPQLTPKRQNIFEMDHKKVPGPGQYDQKENLLYRSLPSFRFDKDERIKAAKTYFNIGPGQYETNYAPTTNKAPLIKFGNGQRQGLLLNKDNPGPGQYEIPTKIQEGPKYCMSPKLNNIQDKLQATKAPAPNKYEIDLKLVKEKHLAFKIGNEARFFNTQRSFSPQGPGNYSTVAPTSMVNSPMFSFGKETRKTYDNEENIIYEQRQKLEKLFIHPKSPNAMSQNHSSYLTNA